MNMIQWTGSKRGLTEAISAGAAGCGSGCFSTGAGAGGGAGAATGAMVIGAAGCGIRVGVAACATICAAAHRLAWIAAFADSCAATGEQEHLAVEPH